MNVVVIESDVLGELFMVGFGVGGNVIVFVVMGDIVDIVKVCLGV